MNKKNEWYNTARTPKFFIVDAKFGIFVIIFLIHIRIYTFLLLVGVFIFFFILDQNKINFKTFLKLIREGFSGKIKKIRKTTKK